MKKRILSLLLAMVMTVSLLPSAAMAAEVEKFSDVSKDDWFFPYVDFVTDEGFFVGTSETTFSPEMTMTRAMFVVVMAAMEGVKVDNNVAPFSDVPANTWYSGAVDWAAKNGVIAGVGNNKFAPDAEISREQMAVIMNAYVNWHSAQYGEDHSTNAKIETFTDKGDVSAWAVEAVDNCRAWGLIAGAPNGKFYPLNNASRAEVATVVYNLAWLVYGGGGGGDIPDPRYYSVTYHMNDGSGAAFQTVTNIRKNTAHAIIDAEPTRAGFTFLGWNTAADGSGTAYDKDDTIAAITANVDLYAQWAPNAALYTVTYHMNDGTGAAFQTISNIVANSAHAIIDDEPTRAGFTFLGWNTAANGSGTAYDKDDTIAAVTGNIDLYAQWSMYTDYIYKAIKDVMADVKADANLLLDRNSIDDTVKNFLNAHGLMKYVKYGTQNNGAEGFVELRGDKSFVSVTGVEVQTAVTATTRPIKVTGLVKVEADTLVNLYHMAYDTAVNYATELVLGLVGAGSIDEATALDMAKKIAADFEAATGIDISVAVIEKAASDIYAAAQKIRQNALPYAKGLWTDNFKDANGDYYTGNIKIAVEGTDIVTVAVNTQASLVNTTAKQAVTDVAAAFARAMVNDLKSYDTYTSLDDMDGIDVVVNVNFSVPTNGYAEDIAHFPTEYPITFSLDIGGTATDSIQYKYDNNTNHIKFVVSDKIKAAYADLANKLVNEAVLDALNSKMDAVLDGLDFTFGTTYSLRSRAATAPFDFETLKKDAMDLWLNGNLTTGNIAESPMMDYITSDGAVDNFDHSALFDLIDATLDNAMDKFLGANFDPTCGLATIIREGLNDPATVEQTFTDWTSEEVFNEMKEMGLLDYSVAVMKDRVTENGNFAAAARPQMEQKVADIVMDKLDEVIAPANPEDAIVPDLDKYLDLAAKLSKLSTVDGMADITFGNLNMVLDNTRFQNFVKDHADSAVTRVAELVKHIPAGASVEMFGKTIDDTDLAKVRDAEDAALVCGALADIVEKFSSVTLGDFDNDGQIISVKNNGKTVNFGLAIDF